LVNGGGRPPCPPIAGSATGGIHKWFLAYKTHNNSETVENRAKVTINCLYKVMYDLSIGAKMYDLEWSVADNQNPGLPLSIYKI